MALITPQSGSGQRHILGDMVMRDYVVSGSSGDTLLVPFNVGQILFVSHSDAADTGVASKITALAYAATVGVPYSITVTITASAPFTQEVIRVWSRVG